ANFRLDFVIYFGKAFGIKIPDKEPMLVEMDSFTVTFCSPTFDEFSIFACGFDLVAILILVDCDLMNPLHQALVAVLTLEFNSKNKTTGEHAPHFPNRK